MLRLATLFILVLSISCNPANTKNRIIQSKTVNNGDYEPLILAKPLLASRFNSLDDFKSKVQVKYFNRPNSLYSKVQLKLVSANSEIHSELESGISQNDIVKAKNGGIWDKVKLTFEAPYAIRIRQSLKKGFVLARRRKELVGYREVAFYDLALALSEHINNPNVAYKNAKDSSEKGYINTFNHIAAQAVLTSFFSQELATFMADVHERKNMPEITTGNFSEEQLRDTVNFPEDNYVDIINNTIGQELGLALRKKYNMNELQQCTPQQFANYMNELQSYLSWSMGIGMEPFNSNDEVIVRFAHKLDYLLSNSY